MIKELYKAHRFFVRKSQHYVLGDWSQYEEIIDKKLTLNWQLLKYYKGFLPVYLKFMWAMYRDIKNGYRLPEDLMHY